MANINFVGSLLRKALCLASVFAFVLPIFSVSTANAGLSSGEKDGLRQVIQIFQKHKTAKSLIEELKPEMDPEYYEFLKARAEELGDTPLVKVSLRDSETVLLQSGTSIAPFKIVSLRKQLFELNNKTLDLSNTTIEERFEKTARLLPSSQKTSGQNSSRLLQFVFENAFADMNGGRIGAGGIAALGGLATGAAACVASVACAPIAVGSVVLGWAAWSISTCKDFTVASNKCQNQQSIMDKSLRKHSKIDDAIKNEGKRPLCEKPAEAASGKNKKAKKAKDEEEEELIDSVSAGDAASFLAETVPENEDLLSLHGSVCIGKQKARLAKCLPELAVKMRYLCIETGKYSEKLLPEWAKKDEEPPAPKSPTIRTPRAPAQKPSKATNK